MGLKLRFLSCWVPEWFQKKGLDELFQYTVKGLEEVLLDNEAGTKTLHGSKVILKGDLSERRRIMSITHNELVKTMIKSLGRDEAIILGREAMFKEGLALGKKFREILGVGDSLENLISAARILYKVLGIEFDIKEIKVKNRWKIKESKKDKKIDCELIMVVNHCSLAEYYTPDTCLVLSAADEGVVKGLNPQVKMKFTERITKGAPCCLAPIQMESDEK